MRLPSRSSRSSAGFTSGHIRRIVFCQVLAALFLLPFPDQKKTPLAGELL
jgi:hypothetical protein